MVYKSIYPTLDIPDTNILSYLFPKDQEPSDTPIWIDVGDSSRFLSPRQALKWIKELAASLDQFGVAHGETVMTFTPNHIFVPVAYLAVVGSGRVFSGANATYTAAEVQFQIEHTGTKLVLAHPSLLEIAVEAGRKAGLPKNRIFIFSDHPHMPVNGVEDWRSKLSATAGESYFWDEMLGSARSTVATVNYSSGTTGFPKGVCVSHHNIVATAEQTIFMRDQEQPYKINERPPERWVGFLPLYHAYGQLYMCVMAPKLLTPVYVMQKFVYEDFLRCIQTHRITHLQAAPPILIMLDKRPETVRYDLSSLRNIMCGAAPLSKELQNAVSKKLNVNIIQGWGMTELTCAAIHVPGGFRDDSGSVGLLNPNSESKLLDEDGKEVPPGRQGEIYIRGPHVCLGYWKNEQETKETIDEQKWLKTGDVGIVKNNWFWIVDRKKELIKVNALQVAPAELEATLLGNDDIADAAVVGITLHGEEWPRAYITVNDSRKAHVNEVQIQNWMKTRVAKHKQLVGGIKFVDEVPRLASGKIKRTAVREWAKQDAKEMEKLARAKL